MIIFEVERTDLKKELVFKLNTNTSSLSADEAARNVKNCLYAKTF